MNNLKFSKILNLYKDKKILFWGASLFLKDYIQNNDLSDFKILGIIDKNHKKNGSNFAGYRIISPQNIQEFEDAIIINAIKNSSDEIYNKLTAFFECANFQKNIVLAENPFANRIEKLASNHIYFINDKGEKFEVSYIEGLNVVWLGENSTITFYTNDIPKLVNTTFRIKDNSQIKIGFNAEINNLLVRMEQKDSILNIGNNFKIMQGEFSLTYGGNAKIEIGDNCLFSSNVCLRNADGHTIYNNESGKILNFTKGISIGNHVWVGNGVHILKSSRIPNNTIIGTKSVVNKQFEEENTIIAGIPAKIIKKNINWSSKDFLYFRGEYYEE